MASSLHHYSGFSSSANFAKAVKQHFGHSPSQIRKGESSIDSKIGKVLSKYGKVFNPADLYPYHLNQQTNKPKMAEVLMNILLKKHPQQTICKLASDGGYQPEPLFKTWDDITSWGEGQGIEISAQQRIDLCHDNPAVFLIITQKDRLIPNLFIFCVCFLKLALNFFKECTAIASSAGY